MNCFAHRCIVISDSTISREDEDVTHPDDAGLTLPSSAVIDEVVEDVTSLSHSPQIKNRNRSQPPPLPTKVKPSISALLASVEPNPIDTTDSDYSDPGNDGMLLILFTKSWFMVYV